MITMIYVTTRSETEASQISEHLVTNHLVACANYFPIKSLYYWEGTLEKSDEYGLVLKTQASKVDEVITEITNLHSYEVPCIVTYKIDKGHQEFLDWVVAETNFSKDTMD